MAFLMLDGWTVRARSGRSRKNIEELGEKERVFSGQLRSTRRAIKDSFSFVCQISEATLVAAIVGVLLGIGDNWLFGSSMTSEKGQAGGDEVHTTVDSSVAADGNSVPGEGKFGGSARISEGTNNVSDNSDANALSWAGTLTDTSDATRYIVGSNSRKFTGNAGQNSVATLLTPASTSPGNTYVVSVYYFSVAGGNVSFRIKQGVNVGAWIVVSGMDADFWRRIENIALTIGTGLSSTAVELEVRADSASSDFRLDGVQLEAEKLISTEFEATVSSVRDDSLPEFAASVLADNVNGFTFNVWVYGPVIVDSVGRMILSTASTNSSDLFLLIHTTGTEIVLNGFLADGTIYSISKSGLSLGESWSMITVVFQQKSSTGNDRFLLYIDGVLEDSVEITAGAFDLDAFVDRTLYLGNDGSGSWLNAAMSEPYLAGFAATTAQIAAWFVATIEKGAKPRLQAEGDFTRKVAVEALGNVDGIRFTEAALSGTFANNSQELEFSLDEA